MELVIFVGLQGSGKSTFYRERFAQTHVLVSKDLLRNNRRPERRQRQLIDEALAEGKSVVVDNTNPTPGDRLPLAVLGRAAGARVVGYYFASGLKECLERNRRREGRARVPDVALFAAAKRLRPPSYMEGFDHLYQVRIAGEGGWEVTDWQDEPPTDTG
jgi:predicted kinase